MIGFPIKRIFRLIGVPRAGKDSVAKYLQETRGFATLAFADRIKEEFGISKEDFELAKISGDIARVRQELWDFSEEKREKDPLYFVRRVMEDAIKSTKSVVITDIRTPEELDAFRYYKENSHTIRRVYYVSKSDKPLVDDFDEEGGLLNSKLSIELMTYCLENREISLIQNKESGLYYLNKYLDNFFLEEDIMDIPEHTGDSITRRSMVSKYLSQFEVSQRRT